MSPRRRTVKAPAVVLGPNSPLRDADLLASARGKLRRASGASFQQMVGFSNDRYRELGEAVIYDVPPRTAGYGRSMRFAGKGPPDYAGRYGSHPVCFDAKVITGKATYQHDSTLSHQLDDLEAFAKDPHALAFLLLYDAAEAVAWILDVRYPRQMQALRDGTGVPVCRHAKGRITASLLPQVPPASPGRPFLDYLATAALACFITPARGPTP